MGGDLINDHLLIPGLCPGTSPAHYSMRTACWAPTLRSPIIQLVPSQASALIVPALRQSSLSYCHESFDGLFITTDISTFTINIILIVIIVVSSFCDGCSHVPNPNLTDAGWVWRDRLTRSVKDETHVIMSTINVIEGWHIHDTHVEHQGKLP